ncbi:MAG: hypothetical protein ACRC2R_16950 [Xenococcaceae cyanobacterium]
MKRKTKISRVKAAWIPPTTESKFKIGDLVMMDAKSTTIPHNSIGRIYGILYKIDTQFNMAGFWYDIHFEGFIAHHTLGEPLLKGVEQ